MPLPEVTIPAELAERLGWSERRLRDLARRLGACRVLGNRMILLPEDVRTIMEASKCRSISTSAARSGTTGARLPEGDYAGLVKQRTKTSRPVRVPRSQLSSGNISSMDRKR